MKRFPTPLGRIDVGRVPYVLLSVAAVRTPDSVALHFVALVTIVVVIILGATKLKEF